MEKNIFEIYDSIKDKIKGKPDIGLVLGSGLGDFAKNAEDSYSIEYKNIEGFPVSTVTGHEGRYIFGKIGEKNVVIMQGRVHFYEGYDMQQVVLPIRLMGLMGIKSLILTNAAGGVNTSYAPGDLMMITDHITSFTHSPLIGKNIDELGSRFPDMSEVYNREQSGILADTAKKLGIKLQKGVYLQTTGPNYETPAEIRMFRLLGADAVGMSTACEAMAAVHMGISVSGVSCITNMAAGVSKAPLNHEEVKETALRVSENFTKLIKNYIIAL